MGKPILFVDFYGVIYSYEYGWQAGQLYGNVVPGFFEWLDRAQQHFTVVVYSSRSKEYNSRVEMEAWINERCLEWVADTYQDNLPRGIDRARSMMMDLQFA